MDNDKLVSLYEHLGKAAGSKLGRLVNQAAQKAGISPTTREVSNKAYTGKVFIYPESFLTKYFNNETK